MRKNNKNGLDRRGKAKALRPLEPCSLLLLRTTGLRHGGHCHRPRSGTRPAEVPPKVTTTAGTTGTLLPPLLPGLCLPAARLLLLVFLGQHHELPHVAVCGQVDLLEGQAAAEGAALVQPLRVAVPTLYPLQDLFIPTKVKEGAIR